jgi:hypothetical protein
MFRRQVGYNPDLRNPIRYNEKLAWRKLYQKIPFAAPISDKLAVRDYVEKRVGGRYLKDVIAVYDSAAELDLAALPASFAAKATHGSGFNVFVPDRDAVDERILRSKLRKLLARSDFGRYKNEWWYSQIEPRIVIEPLLTDRDFGSPVDYELYVFDGRTELMTLTYDRFGEERKSCYDREWRHLDISNATPGPDVAPPRHLPEIIEVGEELARGMDFVRIDLMCPNDEAVLFGEVTLTPRAGLSALTKPGTDELMGSWWKLRPELDVGWP